VARTSVCSLVAGIGLVFCPALYAFQNPFSEEPVTIATRVVPKPAIDLPNASLRIDTSLVLVPVQVTTQFGTSVTNLDKANFRIFEDNVEQTITHFSKDDAPTSIGLLFDASGSMHNKLGKSSEAAAALFKTANPEDEFFLVEFNDRPRLAVRFTNVAEELYDHILHTRTTGRTSLLDAIHLALVQMKNAKNQRRAIVIISDGGDNFSRHSVGQIREALVESEVQLYAMGIFDPEDASSKKKRPKEEVNGPSLLTELAELSGGTHYPVENLDDLPAISERIGLELRNQYVLGYNPANLERDGKYRRIKLNLVTAPGMPALRTQYRKGYYAPSEQ
jgi:Ca-activated chloride channel homolog